MRKVIPRLGLLAGSTLLATLFAVWALQRSRPAEPLVRFHQIDPSAERRPAAVGTTSFSAATPEEWPYFLSRDHARRLFGFGKGDSTYDPWTYGRPESLLRRKIEWAEHPHGSWWMRTNSLGLRDDNEVSDPPADLRVLVAGDSHTFGVCSNEESFANLLEARLADRRAGQRVEVINAGSGGYSFYNYLGTLHRLRSFDPHVFVVTVYAGNDFNEVAAFHQYFRGEPFQQWPPEDLALRNEALGEAPEAMAQCYNGALALQRIPGQYEMALGAAIELCLEMDSVCRARGIQLVVCVVPSACDSDWNDSHDQIRQAQAVLGLTPADLEVTRRIVAEFLLGLEAAGIPGLDMGPIFRRQPTPPFWRRDLHMDLDAQRLIAAALEPLVEARLPMD